MSENIKDETGLSPKERHEIVITYLKKIKKDVKCFKLRYKPGDLISANTMLKTPIFWYMRYKWGRAQIEKMLLEARVEITVDLDDALTQVFGEYDGPRWNGWKGNKKKKRKTPVPKTEIDEKKLEIDVNADLLKKKQSVESEKKQLTQLPEKQKGELEQKNDEIWNVVSNFNKSDEIDHQQFSDNLNEKNIKISPEISKALFDQIAGDNGKMNKKQMEDLLKKIDAMQIPDNAKVNFDDIFKDLISCYITMKKVLLAITKKKPFNFKDFAIANTSLDKQESKQDIETVSEDEDAGPMLHDPFPNQVSLSRTRPVSYYVGRAKRILRYEKNLTVIGRSTTMSVACTLVEHLKRQKIAKATNILTTIDTLPYFVDNEEAGWVSPIAAITFELERDILGQYISDFQQRKVIDIFESQKENISNGILNYSTDEKTGSIVVYKVGTKEERDLSVLFKSEEAHLKKANEFLEPFNKAGNKIRLPDFIKYVSHLIHPLLTDKFFKTMIDKIGAKGKYIPAQNDKVVQEAAGEDMEDLD